MESLSRPEHSMRLSRCRSKRIMPAHVWLLSRCVTSSVAFIDGGAEDQSTCSMHDLSHGSVRI